MKKIRCGKCGKEMKEETQDLFSEKIRVNVCACGKELVNVTDIARIQKNLMPKIHEIRIVTTAGSSSAVTIPKKLERFFRKGDEVIVDFDPDSMELRIKRAA